MLSKLLALMVASAWAQPVPTSKVETARWMTNNIGWGVLSTTSARDQGALLGEAFGNPQSFADVNGAIYFFVSDQDGSMIDVFVGNGSVKANPQASFAISEASLHNKTAAATQPACQIGTALGDPENPPCARLVLSGKMEKVTDSAENKLARAALFKRHPSFKLYPPDHDFFVAKMELTGLWLIDFYGGAAIIAPKDYFASNFSTTTLDAVFPESRMQPLSSSKSLPKPKADDKPATARWMASTLNWGVLATTSARSEGTALGGAFGNPYAFADASTGTPYFFASELDASMIDILLGNGSAKADPAVSLALSEASLGGTGDSQAACEIGVWYHPLGDPETPTCARLVLSGTVQMLAANTTEDAKGRAALFAKHPSFANYPPGHDFFVAKMNVETAWLIDAFGGAAIISAKDYFAANPTNKAFLSIV